MNIFLHVCLNVCFGAQKNRLIETVLLSTHNICFDSEIRKISFTNALLYRGLENETDHHGHYFSFRSISPIIVTIVVITLHCCFSFRPISPIIDYRGLNDTLLFLFQINKPDYRLSWS